MKLFAKSPAAHLTLDPSEVIVMLGGEVAGQLESDSPLGRSLSHQPVRVAENVQPFLRRHPCEVTDYELARRQALSLFISVETDSQRNDVHLAFRNAEVPAHSLCVEIADGNKPVHELDIRADQFQGLAAIRFTQTVDEQVFALQRAKDRKIQLALYRSRQRDQK